MGTGQGGSFEMVDEHYNVITSLKKKQYTQIKVLCACLSIFERALIPVTT